MDDPSVDSASLSFRVLDPEGVPSTLELVETFRLDLDDRACDYCLVRPRRDADPQHAGPTDDEGGLLAFRLEDAGLASPLAGRESLLVAQVLLALQSILAAEDALDAPGPPSLPLRRSPRVTPRH